MTKLRAATAPVPTGSGKACLPAVRQNAALDIHSLPGWPRSRAGEPCEARGSGLTPRFAFFARSQADFEATADGLRVLAERRHRRGMGSAAAPGFQARHC